ncbi:MAG: 3-phosphoshikimate 1-carboxyvinyltransferase [Ruminococcaceae bacterium]|nr:3-phosphoshikimate 1-carboxyvinyltransferase [Oscillospiraceae bacterium]
MTVEIKKGKANGQIMAPASKSMAHRSLICGALSKQSTIKGLDFSEDIKATIGCLKTLGANVKIEGNSVTIGGLLDSKKKVDEPLLCGESGSTLRFLLPLCLLRGEPIVLKGTKRLFERSLSVYEDIAKAQGIKFLQKDNAVMVCGVLKSGLYEVKGDISSQFISGLLFALSTLKNDSIIKIEGKFESASYVGLTLKALGDFGVRVTRLDAKSFKVHGSQSYFSQNITVEGDYSNAAFFDALNVFGGNVLVKGLDPQSIQGDRVYKDYFKAIENKNSVIDLTDCPDLGPILFALAAAKGGAVFSGTERLRIKESDRVSAMADELSKFSIPVKAGKNTVEIGKATLKKPTVLLDGHNDHRIVMALSVLCTITGGKIMGAEAVAKSLPQFFSLLSSLGIEVNEI